MFFCLLKTASKFTQNYRFWHKKWFFFWGGTQALSPHPTPLDIYDASPPHYENCKYAAADRSAKHADNNFQLDIKLQSIISKHRLTLPSGLFGLFNMIIFVLLLNLLASSCGSSFQSALEMTLPSLHYIHSYHCSTHTLCAKKHVTTLLMISWIRSVRLQKFLAHILLRV